MGYSLNVFHFKNKRKYHITRDAITRELFVEFDDGTIWRLLDADACFFCKGYGYATFVHKIGKDQCSIQNEDAGASITSIADTFKTEVQCISCTANLKKILEFYDCSLDETSPVSYPTVPMNRTCTISFKELENAVRALREELDFIAIETGKAYGRSILKKIFKHIYREEKTKEWIIKLW